MKVFDSANFCNYIIAIIAFLFILTLEIIFHLIKLRPEIKGLATFDHCYLYFGYVDDTAFFLTGHYYFKPYD